MGKIALDTSVCIAMLKDWAFAKKLTTAFGEQKPYLPSVAAFELLLRTYSFDKAEMFISQTELVVFDEPAARLSAKISHELGKKGAMASTNDIFIAATAMTNDCELATLNTKDFSIIKGLKLADLP